jgi:Flp pilus assembly protein TadG
VADRRTETGSALLLFPAGVLILLIFGALAFDVALAHQTKRQLLDVAASAANDAVTFGLDEATLRSSGAYCLDPGRARRAVDAAVAAAGIEVDAIEVRIDDPCTPTVVVRLAAFAPAPFASALPGGSGRTAVSAEGRAVARER